MIPLIGVMTAEERAKLTDRPKGTRPGCFEIPGYAIATMLARKRPGTTFLILTPGEVVALSEEIAAR